MSKYQLNIPEKGRSRITHLLNRQEIFTDCPPEYGGKGSAFSSTDLVAAAVGSCYLSAIDQLLLREGHDPKEIHLEVEKELSHQPKMIKAVHLHLHLKKKPSDKLQKMLGQALSVCPVKKSLNSEIEVILSISLR